MTNIKTSSRRNFLKSGALLAAPLAAATVAGAALADDSHLIRAARLEDEAALRELHHSWLARVNAGERVDHLDPSIRHIHAESTGTSINFHISADGRGATGRFVHAVKREVPLALDSTLAQMAHAQGHGSLMHTTPAAMTITYRKEGGRWAVDTVEVQAPV